MKRIKKAKVKYISLCPKGKNKLPTLYKEDGADYLDLPMLLCKGPDFDDKGELLAVVYMPENPDADEHVASADVIKEMAYDFQKEDGQIDIRHDGKPVDKDRAFLAETFIVQKGDPRFSELRDYNGENVDATDSWGVVIKLEDPELRKAYREDGWQGVSLAGPALLVDETKEDTSNLEYEMKPEELEQVLEKNNSSVLDGLKSLVKELFTGKTEKSTEEPAPKPVAKEEPETPKEELEPVFKGDITNPEDVEAHCQALEAFELKKKLKLNDPVALRKHLDSLKKSKGDPKKEENPEVAAILAEKAEVEERLAKAQKASNQPLQKENQDEEFLASGPGFFVEGLSKEDQDLIKLGRLIGQNVNKRREISY